MTRSPLKYSQPTIPTESLYVHKVETYSCRVRIGSKKAIWRLSIWAIPKLELGPILCFFRGVCHPVGAGVFWAFLHPNAVSFCDCFFFSARRGFETFGLSADTSDSEYTFPTPPFSRSDVWTCFCRTSCFLGFLALTNLGRIRHLLTYHLGFGPDCKSIVLCCIFTCLFFVFCCFRCFLLRPFSFSFGKV